MLGINARVEDLREQLIKDINDSHMPACILDYVIAEILNDVRVQRVSEIQKERQREREEKGLTKVERHGDTAIETVVMPKTSEQMSAEWRGEKQDGDNNPDS